MRRVRGIQRWASVCLLVVLGGMALAEGQERAVNGGGSAPAAGGEVAVAAAVTTAPAAVPAVAPAPGGGHDNQFVIGPTDVLSINVWKEPDISRVLPVRPDGKISLPLAGELQAAGQTPLQLEQAIGLKLRNYISDPEVTVMVQQVNSAKYNVLGEVMRPGSFPLAATTSILDAIAMSGGFKDFAKIKGIYILRKNAEGAPQRIPFDYKQVIKGRRTEQNIALQPDDTIVIP